MLPRFDADLPPDMLLEIAKWCDYPELRKLAIALKDTKWMEGNELFWKNYFQKMISNDVLSQNFHAGLLQSKLSNLEICKYMSIWRIHNKNFTEDECTVYPLDRENEHSCNFYDYENYFVRLTSGENGAMNIFFLKKFKRNGSVSFENVFGFEEFDACGSSIPIGYYFRYGIFGIRIKTVKCDPSIIKNYKILFVDHENKQKFLALTYYDIDEKLPIYKNI